MPSKSLIEKVRDIDNAMRLAIHWLYECKFSFDNNDSMNELDKANEAIDKLLLSLDMDYELYMILSRFYEYHMTEVNLIKLRKNK